MYLYNVRISKGWALQNADTIWHIFSADLRSCKEVPLPSAIYGKNFLKASNDYYFTDIKKIHLPPILKFNLKMSYHPKTILCKLYVKKN